MKKGFFFSSGSALGSLVYVWQAGVASFDSFLTSFLLSFFFVHPFVDTGGAQSK